MVLYFCPQNPAKMAQKWLKRSKFPEFTLVSAATSFAVDCLPHCKINCLGIPKNAIFVPLVDFINGGFHKIVYFEAHENLSHKQSVLFYGPFPEVL